ncbi:hypothetical protein [Nesterenkonia sp.]|uniref:hypothetical protein n=1 Tax=Nesterenkonia sp. TaxID=704201 RepID=UPI00260DE5BE|nr:hypothetical protein [Nesterenkonia sp.]
MENIWPYFEVLAPSVGVGLIFWLAMRAIFRADRSERAAEAQIRQQLEAEDAAGRNDDATAPEQGSARSAQTPTH